MATQYQCGFPVVLRDKKTRTTSNTCIYYIFYIFNLFFQVRFTDISQGDSNGRRISKNISTCFRFSMGVVYFISVYHGSFFTAVSGWRLTFTTVPWIGRQSIHRPLSVLILAGPTISSLYRWAFAPLGLRRPVGVRPY